MVERLVAVAAIIKEDGKEATDQQEAFTSQQERRCQRERGQLEAE